MGIAVIARPANAAIPSSLIASTPPPSLSTSSQGLQRAKTPSVTAVTLGALVRSCDMDRECELALVRRIHEGDAAAFDVVHAEFNARLFGFLARVSRNRDVAEDLLEETW